jgi:hypothetical protein
MSDFEMVMVFNETMSFLLSGFTTYLSIIFAFLVASTFLASHLTRTMAAIAVGLFSLASAFFIAQAFAVATNVGLVVDQIRLMVAQGRSSLGWLGFVPSGASMGTIMRLAAWLMTLAFVAALVFFFHQRRVATAIPVSREV